MTAHKHAEVMALYAQDAAETDTPWERWERRPEGLEDFHPLRNNPEFDENVEYRRKLRTIRIGERDVPEPMKEAPKNGTAYWVVTPIAKELVFKYTWTSGDCTFLGKNLCHTTKEAAIAHAEALILVSGGAL